MKRTTRQSKPATTTVPEQVGNAELYQDLLARKKRGLSGTAIVVPLISEQIGVVLVDIDQLLTLVKPKEELRARPKRK